MTACLDCGQRCGSRDGTCPHCGGRLAPPDRRGFRWAVVAIGAIATRLALQPVRATLRRRDSKRDRPRAP